MDKALRTGGDLITRVDCTVPGGETRRVKFTAGSVTSSDSSGVRYSASITVAPTAGQNTYAFLTTPGALIKIRHGINFGDANPELVDFGVYEVAQGGANVAGGGISLRLVDLWQRLDRVKFSSPYYPTSGTRASRIAEVVAPAVPSATIYATNDGGNFIEGDNLWDRDRTAFVNDMCKDGSLDAAFDAAGNFRIRKEPTVDPTAAVWTFRTGVASNINSAERESPFDKPYNAVMVRPIDDSQGFEQQLVKLADPDHPNHESKVGLTIFFYASPTAATDAEAIAAGATILQRLVAGTETVSIDALGNPALEVGDVVSIAHERTDTDPGFAATHLIESFTYDLVKGGMSLNTRTDALAGIEEG